MSVVAGVTGGIYGIGGGSIIARYLVGVAGLSVYRVAGTAMLATFVTSVVGVVFFTPFAHFVGSPAADQPQWMLGLLLGVGGLAGSWLGAAIQKHLPELGIKALLALLVPCQAAFALLTISESRRSWVWRFRQEAQKGT